MLITNGTITRNIAPEQLPEYAGKGYAPVPDKTTKTPAKKSPAKKGGAE